MTLEELMDVLIEIRRRRGTGNIPVVVRSYNDADGWLEEVVYVEANSDDRDVIRLLA